MLPSSGRSIGEQSVTTLPANRSIILADSRFRPNSSIDTPYDFNCDLSGTAIYAKEIFYQKLFWNQPLFAHNNASCELRFSVSGPNIDSTIVFIVYVTPFVMFTQYDGNVPGTSFLTPQLYSYANNIELALNGDVRSFPQNTTLFNLHPNTSNNFGFVTDSNDNVLTLRFRYTPARGFAMYVEPRIIAPNPNLQYFAVTIQPCSFIQYGHFVHGMGIFNPQQDPSQYLPHAMPLSTVFSDCSPNLIPTRYVVIQSPQLNKDRRLISFHNGTFSSFVNELAIFSVNPAYTSAFHSASSGEDATVVSLRDDFTPQSFQIQMLKEDGQVIQAGDPLSTLLQCSGVDPIDLSSYINGALAGRGNTNFINYLVFGYQRIFNGLDAVGSGFADKSSPFPTSKGMGGANLPSQYNSDYVGSPFVTVINFAKAIPLSTDPAVFSVSFRQAAGFAQNIYPDQVFNSDPIYGYFTMFTWYPHINPFPALTLSFDFSTWIPSTFVKPGTGYLSMVMFDARNFERIMMMDGYSYNLMGAPRTQFNNTPGNQAVTFQSRVLHEFYKIPPGPVGIPVGFALVYLVSNSSYIATFNNAYANPADNGAYTIFNSNQIENLQTDYLPPATVFGNYDFGDPLSDALPEEVIHEIAAVLEYN